MENNNMHDVIVVDCITTLFWNYTRKDSDTLKASNDFKYVWETYVEHVGGGQKSFDAL